MKSKSNNAPRRPHVQKKQRVARALKLARSRDVDRDNAHRDMTPDDHARARLRNDRITKVWHRKNEREALRAMIEKEKRYFGS